MTIVTAHSYIAPDMAGPCTILNLNDNRQPCGRSESEHERAHRSLGSTEYLHCVKANCQVLDNPQAGNVTLIVHGVRTLTESRRLKIGEWIWVQSGRPLDAWLGADDAEKVRWTKSHMGKYYHINVETFADDTLDHWSTDYMSGSHPVHMVEIASLDEIEEGRP